MVSVALAGRVAGPCRHATRHGPSIVELRNWAWISSWDMTADAGEYTRHVRSTKYCAQRCQTSGRQRRGFGPSSYQERRTDSEEPIVRAPLLLQDGLFRVLQLASASFCTPSPSRATGAERDSVIDVQPLSMSERISIPGPVGG